jgi:hypothetical protein
MTSADGQDGARRKGLDRKSIKRGFAFLWDRPYLIVNYLGLAIVLYYVGGFALECSLDAGARVFIEDRRVEWFRVAGEEIGDFGEVSVRKGVREVSWQREGRSYRFLVEFDHHDGDNVLEVTRDPPYLHVYGEGLKLVRHLEP